MIRALRRNRFASFVAALALLATLPATFPTFHDDADDVLCNPALVVHDHAAHRIAAASSVRPAPEHCFLCHWLQSHRVVTAATRFVRPAAQSASLAHVVLPSFAGTLATRRPGRAPPLP
jgi:hypothetical protein